MDRSADPFDAASDLEEEERQASINANKEKVRFQQVKDADGNWPHTSCVSCGEDIGEKRLELTGSVICVDCQRENESRGKVYVRN